ncbi:MAG TPA: hypothetical protein VGD98_22960 [Ktedonobacteraceae bacterium]
MKKVIFSLQKQRASLHVVSIVVIVLLAVMLRFILMNMHWPVANADESIMDLMARHVLYQGEHPIFFWGQDHMGTIQAYLGALFMGFYGSSAFSVRLGTLLLFALYIICIYFLVCLLYTPRYALFITALLSIGGDRAMSVPLVANGGYAETMLFAALIFLLASWLALSTPRRRTPVRGVRILAYAGLGYVVGLALWSDQLVLAAVFTAGLLLGICCWSELRSRASGALLLGLLLGAAPLIAYNLSAPLEQNSLIVLIGTTFSGLPRTIPVWQEMLQALLIALPLATSMPFISGNPTVCSNSEPYTQQVHHLTDFFPGSNAWACLGTHGIWSLTILLVWFLAFAGAVLALRQLRKTNQEISVGQNEPVVWRQRSVQYARLMLLSSAALWLLLFAFSAGGQWTPRGSSRYLICLLLAVPAVLWPLWQSLSHVRARVKLGQRFASSRFIFSAMLLSALVASYLVGLVSTVATLSDDQSAYKHVNTLIATLLNHGVTRFYSDYDTCSLLIFQSNEQVICSVLDTQLQPGMNRYNPYVVQVTAATHPAYLFPVNSPEDQKLAQNIGQDEYYRHLIIEGDSIYYYVGGS